MFLRIAMQISFMQNLNMQNVFGVNKTQNRENTDAPKLSVLTKDTVSFTGSKKFDGSDMANAPSKYCVNETRKKAEYSRVHLQEVLEQYLKPFQPGAVSRKFKMNGKKQFEREQEHPVATYSTRVKKTDSIRTKVVSKYTKRYQEDADKIAEQISAEIKKNFVLKDSEHAKTIDEDIKNIVNADYAWNTDETPYSDTDALFTNIIAILSDKDVIDLSNVTHEELSDIIEKSTDFILNSEEAEQSFAKVFPKPESKEGIKYYVLEILEKENW